MEKDVPRNAKPLAVASIAVLIVLMLAYIWTGWDGRWLATVVVWSTVTLGLSMRAWPQ